MNATPLHRRRTRATGGDPLPPEADRHVRRCFGPRPLAGVIVALGLAVAACGSDDDSPGDTGAPTTGRTDPTTSAGSPTTVGSTAAPGTGPAGLDESFGDGGFANVALSPTEHDRFITVVAGADGSVYASGFVRDGDDTAASVTRFTADGEPDTGFGDGGTAVVNVAPGARTAEVARGLVVHEDGSVVLATPFEKAADAEGDAAKDVDVALVRLDSSGALDATFGDGGIAKLDFGPGKAVNADTYLADSSWGLAATASGYVVFGTTPNQAADRTDVDYVIAAVGADGTLDTTFGDGGMVVVNVGADSARNVKVADDGSVVATGYSRNSAGVVSPVLIKTDSDGVLDESFGDGGVATHTVLDGVAESYQVVFQGEKYVMAGYGRGANSDEKVDMVVYRFDADGSFDESFGDGGLFRLDLAGHDDRARNVVGLPGGGLLVVGSGKLTADEIDGLVVMLDADGTPVESFGDGGHLLVDLGQGGDAFFGVAITADGSAAWLAGYSGATPDTDEQDDAVLARIEL